MKSSVIIVFFNVPITKHNVGDTEHASKVNKHVPYSADHFSVTLMLAASWPSLPSGSVPGTPVAAIPGGRLLIPVAVAATWRQLTVSILVSGRALRVSVVGAGVTVTRHPMPGVAPGHWSLVNNQGSLTIHAYYALINVNFLHLDQFGT